MWGAFASLTDSASWTGTISYLGCAAGPDRCSLEVGWLRKTVVKPVRDRQGWGFPIRSHPEALRILNFLSSDDVRIQILCNSLYGWPSGAT